MKTNSLHDFHEMGIIFTSKLGKNWSKSNESEKNASKVSLPLFSSSIIQMRLSPLIPIKILICCKEKYKQEVKIRSIRAVFGLQCQISEVSGASRPGPTWGLAAPSDPPLGWLMTNLFNQVPSCGF